MDLRHPSGYFVVCSGVFCLVFFCCCCCFVFVFVFFCFADFVTRALFTSGAVAGRAGLARPGAAERRPCRPALPCAKPPARRGDLCPFVSCDTQPVFVLKFIHDGYVSLPIACAGSPAERADKLFSAAGPGWGRRAGGWRGPSAPQPSRTGRSLPLPREYARG